MPAEVVRAEESRNSWRVMVGGYSYPVERDNDFLRSMSAAIEPHLLPYKECDLTVTSYVPNGSKLVTEGHLVLSFSDESSVIACIGITFGVTNDDGSPFRNHFDAEKWRASIDSHFSSSIHVLNFDEAWLLACRIGEVIDARNVRMRYGA